MMNVADGILKLRGRWFDLSVSNTKIPMLATLHPAYLLRQPVQKRLAWRDLLSLRERLDSLPLV
jgi:DNA polymerase